MAKKKESDKKDLAADFLKVLPKFLASTGGSLILFLFLLPFVLGQLTRSIPQFAAIFASISEAIKNPEKVASDLGEEAAEALVAIPGGFLGGIIGTGFGIGQDILGAFGIGPTTPKDDRELTYCERLGNDLVLIKRNLDKAKGVAKIQGTFAYATKLYDIKKAQCGKPAFIDQDTWDRVPG